MSRLARFIGIAVIGLGIAALAMGIAFVVEGQSKANYIKEQMRAEQVTLAVLKVEGTDLNNLVDSAAEAEKVANKLKEHRRTYYAATYSDLTALSPNGQYNPNPAENPNAYTQLKYAQAMNLENSLYLSVTALGLTTVTIVSGIFMMVTGLGLSLTGFAVQRLAKKLPATA